MNHNILLPDLQVLLDTKYGKKAWQKFEPETILMDLDFPDYLVMEKIYVLLAMNANLNHVLSVPEFLLWATAVVNNEYADFETITLPTSLELAFLVDQATRLGLVIGQQFVPTDEVVDTLAYLLRMDGYGKAVYPFSFIPDAKLNPENVEVDANLALLKGKANRDYIKKMQEIGHA